jgi:hypothetical protein
MNLTRRQSAGVIRASLRTAAKPLWMMEVRQLAPAFGSTRTRREPGAEGDMHKWECPDRGMIPIARGPAKRDPGDRGQKHEEGAPARGAIDNGNLSGVAFCGFPGGPRPLSIHPDGRWKSDHSVDYGDTIPPLPGAGVMKGGLNPGAAPKRLGPGPAESAPSGTVLSPRGCGNPIPAEPSFLREE